MKSLFAKILLAQVLTVVLALLVVAVITRISLNQGFVEFLERQETEVLGILGPALAELHESQQGWDFLRERPQNWERILRRSRALAADEDGQPGSLQRPGRIGRGPGRAWGDEPPPGRDLDQQLRWLRSLDRLQLRDRLFLLDEQGRHLAGAKVADPAARALQPVEVAGTAVGWVGFAPMGKALPPEAARFLHGQVRVLIVSLAVALGLGGVFAYLLARHLSRPVRALDAAVVGLAQGRFGERAAVASHDEIGRLARNVNRLAAVLEKNRTARQRWMADIAHELRTPVAILKGEVEALADGLRPPDARTLGSLQEEIDQLSGLVDDLQTLALADAGSLNLRLESLDLNQLAAQVADAFRDRLAARGIALDCRFDTPGRESSRPQVQIEGDPQRLRQLLQNLLENSVRYADPDSRVVVAVQPAADGLLLIVEDSGPGIADDQLERVFERFYRLEQGRSRAGGGSGLGLAICRSIVEAHGGRISATRGPLGGLRVTSWLPA